MQSMYKLQIVPRRDAIGGIQNLEVQSKIYYPLKSLRVMYDISVIECYVE